MKKFSILFISTTCIFLLGCGPSKDDINTLKKNNQSLKQEVEFLKIESMKKDLLANKQSGKQNQGYFAIFLGTGGEADGPSTSLEIGRIMEQDHIIGMGVTWLGTNDLAETYYINAPAPSGSTDQGLQNEGDEFELFGVYGREWKKRMFVVGTLGVSQQKKVDLEKAASGALYATSRKKERYITLSAQVRHVLSNGNMLSVGYHTRRGFLAGISIKW